MSQSQQKKKSPAVDDGKTLQATTDRRSLVSTRTSPLIRARFRNPIRGTVCGGGSSGSTATSVTASEVGQGGRDSCDTRRRRSADGVSMSSEKTADETTAPMTTDDIGLEPRIRQYQKHELLQERSPESGLSDVEAFLLEKQHLMEHAVSPENVAAVDKDNDDSADDDKKDKLEPRAPHYVPHPILQVKTETGLTELELYFKQKEAQLEQAADTKVDQQPLADAASS